MPSPFPGMNPYLERDVVWHDFHERFLILGAGEIGAQIRPDFLVRVDDHLLVHELSDDPARPLGRTDLSVARKPHREGPAREGVALVEAPARV